MKWDEITPGEQWIIETLRSDHNLRGWAMREVMPDADTRGIVHIELIDRYGHRYRYALTIAPE